MTTQVQQRMLTIEELRMHAEEFLQKHFDMGLTVPIRISKRMKTRLGHFKYKYSGKPVEIAISYDLMAYNSVDMVIDVLYHECVHYALFMRGEPHKDGDLNFKQTVDRLGVSRTQTFRAKTRAHEFACEGCYQTVFRYRKGFDRKYQCGRCGGRFNYLGEVLK